MNRSRLSRKRENQTKKSLFMNIVGIVVVVILLVKFGLPLLVNFTLLISGSKNTEDAMQKNNTVFIPPPIFDTIPTATNGALPLSGTASPKKTINLYLNDELISKTQTQDNGTFSFDPIKLTKGENKIKAKMFDDAKNESTFSDETTVVFLDKAPILSVDSPSDNQTFKKGDSPIKVLGRTDIGAKVTVDDFWAIVDSNGNYSYNLPLKNGENKIKVVATDDAGNKTEKELKVTFSP